MLKRVSPNAITLTRIALIPVFVPALLARDDYRFGTTIAFAIFTLLSMTDGLDGYVARSRGKVTKLGIFLDPLADKLLITAALVTLVELRALPAWVVVLILSREFAVTGLRMIVASEGSVVSAAWLGKAKTVAQIWMVMALIIKQTPEWLSISLIALAVVLTVWSGAEYFWKCRTYLREPDLAVTVDQPGTNEPAT